jgi:DNA-binding CsgD family transcriptional regulator
MDSAKAFLFLEALAKAGKSKGYHFQARLNCLRARTLSFRNVYYQYYQDRKAVDLEPIKKHINTLLSSAMDLAYRSGDDYLVAFVSSLYASTVSMYDVGVAVMYAKNGIDLYEQLSHPLTPEHYQFLAELLYKVREYEECVRYGRKAVLAWPKSREPYRDRYTVNCMNTVALAYHRQQRFDSAMLFYGQALQLAQKTKDTVWTGIVLGNIAQVLYAQGRYDTAYVLFKGDYKTSKAAGYLDNAANSLQWAARTSLAQGREREALAELREAFQLLKLWPDAGYLRNTYYTATQLFRKTGAYDSAFYYNTLYTAVNDSLEKVVATSSLAISRARLNDERSRYQIQTLNREKQAQVLYRNIIIAAIVVFSLLALLVVNRQRLKAKLKLHQAELEMAAAREQVRLFTKNIVEKTALIEKLETQINSRPASIEQQSIISELAQRTILTEEDWTRFKALFERAYPLFFSKLREKASDITIAEQRMAALIRLQLTTRQMASMLGISIDSVHKTRQRLRQRLQLPTDASLELMVGAI